MLLFLVQASWPLLRSFGQMRMSPVDQHSDTAHEGHFVRFHPLSLCSRCLQNSPSKIIRENRPSANHASTNKKSQGKKWRYWELNPGPLACKASALPTELYPLDITSVSQIAHQTVTVSLSPCKVHPVFV